MAQVDGWFWVQPSTTFCSESMGWVAAGGKRLVQGCPALLNLIGFQLWRMEAAFAGICLLAKGDPASLRHPGTGLKTLAHQWCFSAPTAKEEQM